MSPQSHLLASQSSHGLNWSLLCLSAFAVRLMSRAPHPLPKSLAKTSSVFARRPPTVSESAAEFLIGLAGGLHHASSVTWFITTIRLT